MASNAVNRFAPQSIHSQSVRDRIRTIQGVGFPLSCKERFCNDLQLMINQSKMIPSGFFRLFRDQ